MRCNHAAGVADRLRHGDTQSVESSSDRRSGARARVGRRRRGHGVGCGHRDGARLRWRTHEYRDCTSAGSGADGACDAARDRRRTRGVSRRTHAAQALRRESQLADIRPDRAVRRIAFIVRASVALAAIAFASTSTAISLAAKEIAELCANAEDQAHCGRLIEEVQLKRLPGLAARDGDDLKVSLFPSGTTIFHDSVAITGAKSFTLWDYFDWINAVVLFTTDGDQSGFVLLQRANGKQYRMTAEPILSPDRKHLVTVDVCAKLCDREIAVWRV